MRVRVLTSLARGSLCAQFPPVSMPLTAPSKPLFASQCEMDAAMRGRAAALSNLFRQLGIPLECVYTSWEDAMRTLGSCWGSNIADIGLVFRTLTGAEVPAQEAFQTYGFKCRSNNMHEVLIEIDARVYKMIVCDPNGQNPRTMFLADVLKNAGALFAHYGLPAGCNLYDPAVDNGKVKLRLDLIFAPKGATPKGEEFAVKEFALTKYSYQARTGDAKNVDLFSHPQGTACSDDVSGKKFLRPQVYDPKSGQLNSFWFEAESTGKSVQDMHTETIAESQAAAARGKGTAVHTGMPGWGRLPNIFHFIQVPLMQNPPSRTGSFWQNIASGSWTAAQWGSSVSAAVYDESSSGTDEEADEEEEAPTRSLSHRSLVASASKRSAKVESARLSRGQFAGADLGVQSKTVERAMGEPITITCTMVVVIDGDGPPAAADVRILWETIKTMAKVAGEAKNLHDPTAGLAEDPSKLPGVMAAIFEKQETHPAPPQVPPPPVAPTVGVPVEV